MANRFRQRQNFSDANFVIVKSIVESHLESLPYHYTVHMKPLSHQLTTSELLEQLWLVKSSVYRYQFDWWLKSRLFGFGILMYIWLGIATTFSLLAMTIVFALQILVFGLLFGIGLLALFTALLILAVLVSESGDAIAAGGIGVIAGLISWFVVSVIHGFGQNIFEWVCVLSNEIGDVNIRVDRAVFHFEMGLLVGGFGYVFVVFWLAQDFLDDGVNNRWLWLGHLMLVLVGFLKTPILEIVASFMISIQERLSNMIEAIDKGT